MFTRLETTYLDQSHTYCTRIAKKKKNSTNIATIKMFLANTPHCSTLCAWIKYEINRTQFTFLALVGGPTAVIIVVIERRPLTKRVILHDARANIVTLLCLLIPIDNIVELSIHDQRPVHRVQVAELGVLFNPHGSPGDVPQVVQADVLQAGHLVDHQGVVVEKIAPADDTQVGEKHAEAVQAGDAKQQQVASDDGQLWEAEGAEVLLVDVLGLVVDEEDVQVALHHRTVLQPLELTDVISDVDARTADCKTRRDNK